MHFVFKICLIVSQCTVKENKLQGHVSVHMYHPQGETKRVGEAHLVFVLIKTLNLVGK